MYSALSTLFREEFIALFTRKKKAPSLGNITRLTLNPNMTNALNSRENPSEQQNNASSQKKKPPLAEFEFALLPCMQTPSKRRLVRVRFETSSLRELLQRRREQRDRGLPRPDRQRGQEQPTPQSAKQAPLSSFETPSPRTPKRIEFAEPLQSCFNSERL